MIKKLLPIIVLLFCFCGAFGQVPVISSFTPASGPAGATVTITGKNFNATTTKNIVYFGAVKAVVKTATATSLVVTVPAGATYKQITVTTNGLLATSPAAFIVTYATGGGMLAGADPFAPQTELPAGNATSHGMADQSINADFDGDGKPDLIVSDHILFQFHIYRNTGSLAAPFSSTPTVNLSTQYYGGMVTGDVDGDGKIDLITAGGVIFKNISTPGNITFTQSVSFGGGSAVATGDFNGDGKLDIATCSGINSTFSVSLNTTIGGNISFAAQQAIPTYHNPYDIAVGDMDGDGKPDVIIANHSDFTVSVFRNTFGSGKLSFAPKVDYWVRTSPIKVRVGDLDGDGKPDIIVTNHLDFGDIKTGTVFRNIGKAGTIAFEPNLDFYVDGPFSSAAELADMDGDGKPDIIMTDNNTDEGLIIHNTSTPGFIHLSGLRTFGKLNYPTGATVGDFNGDGMPDIVATSVGGTIGSTSVFINQLNPSRPVITSFSPTTAASGTIVYLTGTGFTGATAVEFGGVPATYFKVNSPTSISATVGAGQSGSITITTPKGVGAVAGFTLFPKPVITGVTIATYGTKNIVTITGQNISSASAVAFNGVAALAFASNTSATVTASVSNAKFSSVRLTTPGGTITYNYIPPPVITKITPASARQGETVTITGANFSGATGVSFGSRPAASFVVNSATTITAKVGNALNSGLSVTTPGGNIFFAGFTFIPTAVPPVITSFSPAVGRTGDGIVINGTGFSSVSSVTLGGKSSAFSTISSSQIVATVGTGASGNIQVTTPLGTASAPGFTYTTQPAITAFTPTSAGTGQQVVITGDGIGSATAISFGGVTASSFIVNMPNRITATVGAGKSGNVALKTAGGTAVLAGFTYLPGPTVTSFAPARAKTGDPVIIKGTNFTGVTNVLFGTIRPASFTVNSPTQITAIIGDGATGNVHVETRGGTASGGVFTYDQLPVIYSCTPIAAGAQVQVMLTGSNFTGVTGVSFGGVPAKSFAVNADSWMTAIVGTGATGDVTVTSPVGTGRLNGFKYLVTPLVTSVSPLHATTGATVLISGTNLTGVTKLKFGTVDAKSFVILSDTQISAVVGGGETGKVYVESLGGFSSGGQFTYDVVPLITRTGYLGGDEAQGKAYIQGFNFTGATKVSFGGVPASSFVVKASTDITAIPGKGASGDVSVTTPLGTATLTGFIYQTIPTIASVTPAHAKSEQTVVITGTSFTRVTRVQFGTVAAKSFVVNSDKQITAVVGAGATGNIYVESPFGSATGGMFTYDAGPAISALSPSGSGGAFGWYGSAMVITGYNLTGATKVSFGGVPAALFTVTSPTSINAVIANGASGAASVTTPTGTATFAGFTYFYDPKIISFTPKAAGPGQAVTITGADLTNTYSIMFGNVATSNFHVDSRNQITATVPDVPTIGPYGTIKIIAVEGEYPADGFTFLPKPAITSFTASSTATGMTLTLTGTGFTGATKVMIGTVNAKSFTINSDKQITAVIGAGVSGIIYVESAGGTGTGGPFAGYPTPVITTFSPKEAPSQATVVITGTGFKGATKVMFNTISAKSFVVNSDTQISAVVGAGESGLITVQTPGGSATVGVFNYDPPPVITSISPTSGTTQTKIFVTGNNFGGLTKVSFGGVPAASFQLSSPTTLTATVGNGASGDVLVTTVSGTAKLSGFTYVPKIGNTPGNSLFTAATDAGKPANLVPYPNPFDDILYVNLGNDVVERATVKIFNIADGRLMLQKQFGNQAGVVRVDVSGLSAGVYSYHLVINNTENVFKIYKK